MYQNMAGYNDLTIYDDENINDYTKKLSGAKCFYLIFVISAGIVLGLSLVFAFLELDIVLIIAVLFRIT